jgi:ubiquinone/menaquinone biosynthesis C-methylase UbiE
MASNTRTRETRDPSDARPEICDYEDSTYRTDFWTQERSYEDAAERIALKALLPPMGDRLIEIGAGFGRLVDLYAGYEQVVLLDYSRSMLREARAQWGDAAPSGRPRYTYVAADFYALPFVAGLFDTVTMIRVIHHAQDAPRVLQGISDITAPGGSFVLEFANKRNLKAIARWILRKQSWNPHDLPPYEFADLNFDFHPQWIQRRLHEASFSIKTQRTVSHLRLDLLKRLVPTPIMARLDGLLQPTGRWWQFTPSVFVLNQAPQTKPAAQADTFFRCPACGGVRLSPSPDRLACHSCQRSWPIRDGLYDFKEPL